MGHTSKLILTSFTAHRNWIETLHSSAWAFLGMVSIEMLQGLQPSTNFFGTRPEVEVPLPTS